MINGGTVRKRQRCVVVGKGEEKEFSFMLELGSFCIHNNKLCEYCARLNSIYYIFIWRVLSQ